MLGEVYIFAADIDIVVEIVDYGLRNVPIVGIDGLFVGKNLCSIRNDVWRYPFHAFGGYVADVFRVDAH
ncbi:hypothetical protein AQ611_17810 [Burkholderia singularis]|nr:hypothetical protein AQ611_17810 [Burkholderia sp. Bp7605]